ncbi:hypothetical protein ABW21_db0203038 [Orbilia brochopaga]|nr:hypothetical protein ABW21_db0203038 [Drechslerella brochopaga]
MGTPEDIEERAADAARWYLGSLSFEQPRITAAGDGSMTAEYRGVSSPLDVLRSEIAAVRAECAAECKTLRDSNASLQSELAAARAEWTAGFKTLRESNDSLQEACIELRSETKDTFKKYQGDINLIALLNARATYYAHLSAEFNYYYKRLCEHLNSDTDYLEDLLKCTTADMTMTTRESTNPRALSWVSIVSLFRQRALAADANVRKIVSGNR